MNRKQILVTGASRGIGKACAIHFAKEGWHVFLNCRKSIGELQDILAPRFPIIRQRVPMRARILRCAWPWKPITGVFRAWRP